MIFPYSTSIAEDLATGDFLIFRRPEINVKLVGPAAAATVMGLVDTGADLTIFPLRLARRLQIPVAPADEGVAQVFGGQKVQLFAGEAVLEIAQEHEVLRWRELVWFCDFPEAKDATVVLGHASFLDYFRAEFDGKTSVLTLTPNDDLPMVE